MRVQGEKKSQSEKDYGHTDKESHVVQAAKQQLSVSILFLNSNHFSTKLVCQVKWKLCIHLGPIFRIYTYFRISKGWGKPN